MEAALSQMASELATARAQISALSAAQDDLRAQAQTAIAQSEARTQALIAQGNAAASAEPLGKIELVDFKVNKPENFHGKREESWKSWSRQFKTYCNVRKDGFKQALNWAEEYEQTINNSTIDQMGWPAARMADAKLYDFLFLQCRGDALVLVEAYDGMGFEAWRQLCRRYAPSGGQFELDMMQRLMNPHKAKTIADLPAAILRFERDLGYYHKKTGKAFPEEWKSPTFLRILPDSHKEELVRRFQMGARDYTTLVNSVAGFSREAWFQSGRGQNDMDIDAAMLAPEPENNWEEFQKWATDSDWDTYASYWEQQHQQETEQPVDWMGKKGGKAQGKGKKGQWQKGGGGGKNNQGNGQWSGSGGSKRLCHWCEGEDHLVAQCPVKKSGKPKIKNGKPVSSLEAGDYEDEILGGFDVSMDCGSFEIGGKCGRCRCSDYVLCDMSGEVPPPAEEPGSRRNMSENSDIVCEFCSELDIDPLDEDFTLDGPQLVDGSANDFELESEEEAEVAAPLHSDSDGWPIAPPGLTVTATHNISNTLPVPRALDRKSTNTIDMDAEVRRLVSEMVVTDVWGTSAGQGFGRFGLTGGTTGAWGSTGNDRRQTSTTALSQVGTLLVGDTSFANSGAVKMQKESDGVDTVVEREKGALPWPGDPKNHIKKAAPSVETAASAADPWSKADPWSGSATAVKPSGARWERDGARWFPKIIEEENDIIIGANFTDGGNDLVAADNGPPHVHRERGGATGKQVLWSDPELSNTSSLGITGSLASAFEAQNKELERKRDAVMAALRAEAKEEAAVQEPSESTMAFEISTPPHTSTRAAMRKKMERRKEVAIGRIIQKGLESRVRRSKEVQTEEAKNSQTTDMVSMEVQTDITLPNMVPVLWHPHSQAMHTIVDFSNEATALALEMEQLPVEMEQVSTTVGDDVETMVTETVEASEDGEVDIDWGDKEQVDRLEREAKRAALGLSPDPARRSPGSEEHFFRPISPKDLMERTLAAEGVVKMLLDDDDIENPDEDLRPDLVDSSDEDGENKHRKPQLWDKVHLKKLDSDDEKVERWEVTRPSRGRRSARSSRRRSKSPSSDRPLCPLDRPATKARDERPRRSNGQDPSAAKKVGTQRMRMRRGMTVDSGAADNVIPRRMVKGKYNRIKPSPGSRRGVYYVSATSGRIANEGECDFHFQTKDGEEQEFTFQIAEVNKALCAVSYLVDHGYLVTFDQDERSGIDTSRITHKKSGKMIPLSRDKNVWTIDAYIEEEVENTESPFGRRG